MIENKQETGEEKMEKRKLLIPKIDVVFHSLFRSSKEKLIGYFISSLIQKKVKVIYVDKDRHLMRKYPEEKLGILDLRTELEGGVICNIEVQLANPGNIVDRILYYWSRAFGEQLKEGDEYQELNKTIGILIVDFKLKEMEGIEKLGTKWKIMAEGEENRILTEKLELIILEIPKAREMVKMGKKDKIVEWLMFLDNPNSVEVTKIMEENEEIKEAVEELEEISQDEELKRVAFLKEKYIRDEKSARRYYKEQGLEEGRILGIKQGVKEGIKEGKKEGIKEGKKINTEEIAKKMLQKNFPIEVIMEITNLTEEEVKKIQSN